MTSVPGGQRVSPKLLLWAPKSLAWERKQEPPTDPFHGLWVAGPSLLPTGLGSSSQRWTQPTPLTSDKNGHGRLGGPRLCPRAQMLWQPSCAEELTT